MIISQEVQEIVVSSLLKDSYLYSIAKTELNEGYFESPACKIIYKALSRYFDKYGTLPSEKELIVGIDECYSASLGITKELAINTAKILYNSPQYEEEFVKDRLTDIVRKIRSSKALQSFIIKVNNKETLDNEDVVREITESLEVSFSESKVYNLADTQSISTMRDAAIGSSTDNKIIQSSIPSVNSALQYGGWQPATINMIIAAPGTGKSMFLFNDGATAAQQGFQVLHILIGDLVEYDGFIRYLSLISGTPQNDLIMMPPVQQGNIVNYCNQQYNNIMTRIDLLAYPAEMITIDELEENIKRTERQLNKDYNMIIIDYPDNLKKGKSSNMYEEGGAMYASLERISRLFKATLLVASQPKQCYWGDEILPLESAGESSRKQHAADTIITMGLVGKDAKVGTMSIVKTRRGQKKRAIRFKTAFERCKIEEINEAEYNVLATNYKSGS